jgi:hypothetical protein
LQELHYMTDHLERRRALARERQRRKRERDRHADRHAVTSRVTLEQLEQAAAEARLAVLGRRLEVMKRRPELANASIFDNEVDWEKG